MSKKVLVLKDTETVQAVRETITEMDNHYLSGVTIFPDKSIFTLYDVNENEIPEGAESPKYCYNPERGFYKNPSYVPYVPVEERLRLLENAYNELLLGGM